MDKIIKLSLPIHQEKKVKGKITKYLVGMNWYRNEHFFLSNEVKKKYSEMIKEQLKDNKIKFIGEYKVKYTLYYQSKSCDLSNVCSLISKFLNDTLQELWIVNNDNVQFLTKEVYVVGGLDKIEPRVEIEITEEKCW